MNQHEGFSFGIIPAEGVKHWQALSRPFPSANHPQGLTYIEGGYVAEQNLETDFILVALSPFYTWCELYGPDAPNAGNLARPSAQGKGVPTSCFGEEWFETLPYNVYLKANNQLIKEK